MAFQTCPRCRALLTPGTKVCPYCETDQGAALAPTPQADAHKTMTLAMGVIGVCVFLYFAMVALEPEPTRAEGMQQPSPEAVRIFGLYDSSMARGCGQWWRMFTAMFLHLSLMHLLMNMVAMYILAPIAAQTFGAARAVVIYLVAGAVVGLVNHMYGQNWAGASGAIGGLIGACAMYGHRRGLLELKQRMMMWIVIIFAFGMFFENVDHLGHFVGITVGVGIGYAASNVRARGSRRDRLWHSSALALTVGVVAIGAVYLVPSVWRGTQYGAVGRYQAESERVFRLAKTAIRNPAGNKKDAAPFDDESVKDSPRGADELRDALLDLIARVRADAGARDTLTAWTKADALFRTWRNTLFCQYCYRKNKGS